MDLKTAEFIASHCQDDIHQLALKSSRFPEVDMTLAIQQINGLQKIKHKVPLFYHTTGILFPKQLSLEQSSSESTAKYKAGICDGNTLIDLSGGFGIDCYFMSAGFQTTFYVECNETLCKLATHNFGVLNRHSIQIYNSISEDFLNQFDQQADWIYIDPARRNNTGKKVVLLEDCEPDIEKLAPLMLQKGRKVMIKLSPMIDVKYLMNHFPDAAEIHILSVENECKEVLLILDPEKTVQNCAIICCNLLKNDEREEIRFSYPDEENASVQFANELKQFLYEPNSAIMKGGAFKLLTSRYQTEKLHVSSHLYTSESFIPDFPGRKFCIQKQWDHSKSDLNALTKEIHKANIAVRNFPISVDQLRKKLKIKEGGDIYLFATTLNNDKKVIIQCSKA